jgi:hypothetical protein
MILLGAGAYLFLQMEWIEDRPIPLGAADRGDRYFDETTYRG